MKFSQETAGQENTITHYRSGTITVNGIDYPHSLIIGPNVLVTDWIVETIEDFTLDNLQTAIQQQPELILLGSGSEFIMPEQALQAGLLRQGIGCEAMDSAAACRTYNVLLAEKRQVMAAILPP